MKLDIKKCPICGNKLYQRKDGLVCKNWKCPLYWKMGIGWVFHRRNNKE